MHIPRWASLGLALIGIVIIVIAALALMYAFAPVNHTINQVPVAPTLFAPPPG